MGDTNAAATSDLQKGFTIQVDAQKKGFKFLTQEQVDCFIENGYVAIRGAIPQESLDYFLEDVWVRLGMDPNDKSTWTKEDIHMPSHRRSHVEQFAPKVWGAMCELLGGVDRIDYKTASWTDGFICNLGSEKFDPNEVIDPRDMLLCPFRGPTWHVDGDWFRHFLDSETQALECLVLFSDIVERAGPTYICPDGTDKVVEWLYEHPEGSSDMSDPEGSATKVVPRFVKESKKFVTLTGKTGDVFLCHPLTPHSRSINHIRNSRFIINPFVSLKEPFNLNRSNPDDYSLVELKTLKALNANAVDFKITRDRFRFMPRTKGRKDALIDQELERLKEHSKKTGKPVISQHLSGEATAWQEDFWKQMLSVHNPGVAAA
ncbi:hypothetical protein CALCODRAFT_555099 [Calocera cornea HHB12733]|uniref:Clavaminate synthase-like protein n=1 Tax=Calocera cornea HHB12733 TaxID=1353952 RepID=A0A165GAJ0_9BASI|nr:hypothetical protein CALCODRAFT_555099 [Calocera cornea HHB12733]